MSKPSLPAGGTPAQWWSSRRWSILILAAAAAIFALLVYTANQGRTHQAQSTELDRLSYEAAEVLNVSKDEITVDRTSFDLISTGSQVVLLRLRSGEFAGENVEVTNFVSAFNSLPLKVGDRVTVYQYVAADGALDRVYIYEYDRIWAVYALLAVFFAVVVLVGGRTGLKSLLGLGLTVICVIWVLCPMLMKGADPVWTAFGLCVYVTVVSFVLLGGTGKKILCAILGTVGGTGLAALFGAAAQAICRITSYSMYSTDSLLDEFKNIQLQGIPLHITGLLTAGILIAALGAVMDVAMSLSSAMAELKTVDPSLGKAELWRSAMRIGRDMVGTMTNTLIQAFAGTSLVMILYLWSLDLSFRQLMSSSFLAVELISALSSSIGVVLCVPLTAAIGALVYGAKR